MSMKTSVVGLWTLMNVLGLAMGCQSEASASASASLAPADMVLIGTVDERYQSYNIEMLEVTGGNFWAPYGPELDAALRRPPTDPSSGPLGAATNPALYRYRPPLDLANARLRRLAAALGPAYVRVSGTWANNTYFPETQEAPAEPPPGFTGVLTHQQWKGVVDFAHAVDAAIVTSFATGPGTRDASGAWTPDQALRRVAYTASLGGAIAAAEFMNEPNAAVIGGAPPGYDAAAYGRDFARFREFADHNMPDTAVLGPGSVGEGTGLSVDMAGIAGVINTRDLLAASQPAAVDAFSYHHYGALSQRCAAMAELMSRGKDPGGQAIPITSAEQALSEQWLRRTDETLTFYRMLRDEFAPGTPFWNTETADASCGGNPWAATFLDTFRYLDQLGRLARQDVRVVAHNTLAASDYGLLDEKTLLPRPNYWGAVLWRKLMGSTVLDSGVPIQPGRHVYAHCLRDTPGGVAVLVINNDKDASSTLSIPTAGERYTLSSGELRSGSVQLNGTELALAAGDEPPRLEGVATPAGDVEFAPATITFLALPQAGNDACR
jgi:hypothetical protein